MKRVCKPCQYNSDFDTAAANTQQTIVYMAARIAVFSHALMYSTINNIALPFGKLGRSFFKDCENFRTCTENTENNNCTASGTDTLCDGTTPALIDEITE